MILDEILKNLQNGNDYIAYTVNSRKYTYSELYKYVCNIYNYLLEKNLTKKMVAIYGHKDVYIKAAFLACSFAGITYIPIDDGMPKERVDQIINQAKPDFTIGIDISKEELYKIMEKNDFKPIEKIYIKPEDIYYIIFTSGSTGIPKGVKVTYNNLDSCIKWLENITNIKQGVILNQANFSFDLSVADLYLSLYSLSEHFILDYDNNFNFENMFIELKKSNVTLAVMTPSFADLLMIDKSFNQKLLPNLKKIIFCGEKLSKNTIDKLYNRFENLEIINCYGPTECTFAVTSIVIPRNFNEVVPAGVSKEDVKIYILDENKNQLKDGEIGEILIVGASVADGYIGEDKKNSFIKYNNQNAYLTGDLGYLKDGVLYYIARKDKQIKYKGYRIELTDIENNLLELDYIEKAVVVAKNNKEEKVTNIIAFVKLNKNIEKEVIEIKQDLLERIPNYMCPKIKVIQEFPINKNGKCDEKKLLEEF